MADEADQFSPVLRTFEVESTEPPRNEEEFLDTLADHLAWMIEYRLEYLLSLMYRMDIPEHKISFALSPVCNEPPNIALAKLIVERHKERLTTKKDIRVEDIEDLEEGLEW